MEAPASAGRIIHALTARLLLRTSWFECWFSAPFLQQVSSTPRLVRGGDPVIGACVGPRCSDFAHRSW